MPSPKKPVREESYLELVKSIAWIVAVVLVVRTFIFEPFNIPSGSMVPTLLVGDYLVVTKLNYGLSRYSFPLWNPPFSGRIFSALPARGDVTVFRKPTNTDEVYIKRIIGLPGDKIKVEHGQLEINGTPVPREQVEDLIDEEYVDPRPIRQFTETLPNGVVHNILQDGDDGPNDNTIEYEVPPDHVFAMGDNRSNSWDSRVQGKGGVGYVPLENLIGKAQFIFYSVRTSSTHGDEWSHPFTADYQAHSWLEFWLWPFEIRYGRIMKVIH